MYRPQTGHACELLKTVGIQDLESDSEAMSGQVRDKCWAKGLSRLCVKGVPGTLLSEMPFGIALSVRLGKTPPL